MVVIERSAAACALTLILLGAGLVLVCIQDPTFASKSSWLVDSLDRAFMVKRLASKSNHVAVAELYYAVVAFTFPLSFIYFSLSIYKSAWLRPRRTRKQRLYGLVLVPLLLVFGLGGIISFHGQDSRYISIGSSLTALAVSGWTPLVTFGFLSGFGFSVLTKLVREIFTREG